MRLVSYRKYFIFSLLISAIVGVGGSTVHCSSLTRSDKKYLETLARDTYQCIANYVDPNTGLPLDNSLFQKDAHTSVTNIGFYIASIAGAVEMGFEKRADAVKKLEKVLYTLTQVPTWQNFPHSWTRLADLSPHKERFISTVDLGNYYAGIIVARQYFPELQSLCDQLLDINWKNLYDSKRKLLYGGYNTEKNSYGDWYYDYLGADSRLASFLAIAMSKVPYESWTSLNRVLEERYGIQYLKPGWQGGGLFMAFMTGLFIDERSTLPWFSAGNFAKAQMIHKERIRSPVWGWSASDSPSYGYLGYNGIRDDIVTPHASTLAISIYPKEVVENLKKLEELGARPRHIIDGSYCDFGFRDSIDIKTGRVTNSYLVLDQSMLFMSLVNFLKNRFIIRTFESYPPVKLALPNIEEYSLRGEQKIVFPILLKEKYGLRLQSYDKSRPEVMVSKNPYGSEVQIDSAEWEMAEPILIDSLNIETGQIIDDQDLSSQARFLWDAQNLYIKVNVTDQSVQVKHAGSEIYKTDLVEIYLNPDTKGLIWGQSKDYQIGITPPDNQGQTAIYAWFQNRMPEPSEVRPVSRKTEKGYDVFAAISWKFLGIYEPTKGESFGFSVAINDIDDDDKGPAKINWYFKPEAGKIDLAKMILK